MTFTPTALPSFPADVEGAASDGLADGCTLATEAWGDGANDPDSGQLAFTYLYRRFGPPMKGDPYKDLGRWILTTPDPDVWLTISPAPWDISLGVGYLVRRAIGDEMRAPRAEWERKALHWLAERVAEEHPEWVIARADGLDELDEQGWNLAYERRMTWGEGSWTERVVAALGKPPREVPANQWREGGGPIMQRVNGALMETLRSLLAPVGVRDAEINILGRVGRVPRASTFGRLRAKRDKEQA